MRMNTLFGWISRRKKYRCLFSLLALYLGVLMPWVAAQDAAPPVSQEQKDLDFADGLYQRGMYDNAAKQYADFLSKYPTGPLRESALFRQGESYYQHASKKLTHDPVQSKVALLKARGAFQEWLRLYPQGKRLHESLLRFGEISYKLDDAKSGLDPLLRVVKESKDPTLLEAALFYAGRCQEALGKDEDAIALYRQILSSYAKGEFSAFSAFLMAETLARRGERDKAIELFDTLWKNPGNYKIPEGSNLISDAQLRAAQLLYQLNRFEDASKAYLAYVKDHPEGEAAAKARYGAAWSEYQRKNYAGALEIARTLQRESLPPELLAGIVFLNGTCAYQQKLYDEAILNFRQVIADPQAGDYRERAWYQLAWAYYLSGKYEDALSECENLLQQGLSPAMNSNIHFLLGQSYAQQKNYESAIKEMRISIQVDAGGEYAEEAQYLLADLLYRTEKYNEAGVEFDRFYETFPKSSRAQEALIWSVHSRFAGKEYENAIAAADRLLTVYPDLPVRPDMLYRKALAQYQIKRYNDALATVDAILKMPEGEDDRKAEALYWRAYILDIQNDKKQASEAYGDLMKRYPSFPDRDEVRMRKALCDFALKDYGVAYEGFYAVLFTDRGVRLPPEILFWMIQAADEKERHEEALEVAERILKVFENNEIRERALIARGNQLVALKRWKDAQENAQDFLNTFPDSLFRPEIYWSRAKALEGLDELQPALEWYEKSLTELQQLGNPDPSFEATLFMDRGRLLERLNRTSDALESFLRVAIIYDHPALTPEALYRSIRCHKILKEESEARTLLDELQQRYLDSPWTQKAKAEFENGQAQPASPGEPVSKGQSMKP